MDDDHAQLLAMHATLVETACASETKRQNISVVSMTVISAGIAVFASDANFPFIAIVPPILIVSSIWFITVRYYQQLAAVKWQVIHEIEEKLVFQPFKREWDEFTSRKGCLTFGPSTLEQVVPACIFIAVFAYSVY